MKIITVVGARPQFIKAAVVSKVLRKRHTEILIHTGQHYDYNMSQKFFDELDIPKPDYNLDVNGGSHASMTARMMVLLEEVFNKEQPDWILLYGDTNSTLAAALVAAKLYIPICHVEAGARTYSRTNPEEINRICTDHLSQLLLTSTESGLIGLKKEGLLDRGYFVGDPMYDAFLLYRKKNEKNLEFNTIEGEKITIPKEYYYLTCHREENTSVNDNMYEILKAMNSLKKPIIYPVHPRNKQTVIKLKKNNKFNNILLLEPVGYLESIFLVDNAIKIVTDSGGLQREAFFAEKKCVTVLDFVCWPETMIYNRNTLAKPNAKSIMEALEMKQTVDREYKPFGDGKSAEKIINLLERHGKK